MREEPVRVGVVLREDDLGAWSGRLRELAERALAAGIDHLTVGDHVSFARGHGADGLIQAAALLAVDPRVHVQTGVYLVALRHPAVVARQLATIALLTWHGLYGLQFVPAIALVAGVTFVFAALHARFRPRAALDAAQP